MKTTIAILLASAILVNAGEFKIMSRQDPEQNLYAVPVCLGIAVITAGATAVIVSLHYCKKWFGTNQPKPGVTNKFTVERSDNGLNWNHRGSVTSTFENFSWSETNIAADRIHLYRLSYQP